MSASTPIARSKSAALTRVLDLVCRGYLRYTDGVIPASKAIQLANKFHSQYGIGASPAQRLTKKKHKTANAALVLYWPEGEDSVEWVLLATDGVGLERETLRRVTARRRLTFLGYSLVRRSHRGRLTWTWKRSKRTMASLYTVLHDSLKQRRYKTIDELLVRMARSPGFHGVRGQSWELFQEARRNGYPGELPRLLYIRKVNHGEKLSLDEPPPHFTSKCNSVEL